VNGPDRPIRASIERLADVIGEDGDVTTSVHLFGAADPEQKLSWNARDVSKEPTFLSDPLGAPDRGEMCGALTSIKLWRGPEARAVAQEDTMV